MYVPTTSDRAMERQIGREILRGFKQQVTLSLLRRAVDGLSHRDREFYN